MIDDDEAYGLRCDIGRLEQENATLRQQLEDVTVSMGRLEERHAKTFEVGKRWMAKAARFESENTKLRELIYERAHEHTIQHMTEDELRITAANALDENAKLRELCERMHRHIRQTCGECDCWYCSNFDEDNECCVYDTLARELGVEVDG